MSAPSLTFPDSLFVSDASHMTLSERIMQFMLESSVTQSQTFAFAQSVVLADTSIAIDPFELQKEAFEKIPPLMLVEHTGKYVASVDGVIVDADESLAILAQRFVGTYCDRDAYITRVHAHATPILIRTPFLR